MIDEDPFKDNDKLPDDEVDARFQRTLVNLVNTPHKPHSKRGLTPDRKLVDGSAHNQGAQNGRREETHTTAGKTSGPKRRVTK